MKRFIQIFLISCLALAGLSSCETYKEDFDQDFSPIFPLCGEWRVNIYNSDTLVTRTSIYSYDTADKSGTTMWLWINNSKFGTKCKLTCDPAARTFSGANVANALYTGTTNTVTGGTVVVNGATTPSNGKSDSIEFTYFSSKSNLTYKISGYRRTGWPEDE